MPTPPPLLLPNQHFKQDCIDALLKEKNYPLVLVWKDDNNNIAVSVSSKLRNAEKVAASLYTMLNAQKQ